MHLRTLGRFFRGQAGWGPVLVPVAALAALAAVQADLLVTATVAVRHALDLLVSPDGGALERVALSQALLEPVTRTASVAELALLATALLLAAGIVQLLAGGARDALAVRLRRRTRENLLGIFTLESGGQQAARGTFDDGQRYLSDSRTVAGFGAELGDGFADLVRLGILTTALWRLEHGWLLVAVLIPACLVIGGTMARLLEVRAARLEERAEAHMLSLRRKVTEFFENLREVLRVGGEKSAVERLRQETWIAEEAGRRVGTISALQVGIRRFTLALVPLLVLAVLAWRGPTTPGIVVQASSLVLLILGSAAELTRLPTHLSWVRPFLERLGELRPPPLPGPRPPGLDALGSREEPVAVEVRGLTFGYPAANQTLFRELDLTIPAGAWVCLVGEAGSGKSTLARLLLGELEPASGAIRFDGEEVTRWHPHWRREIVGYMSGNSFSADTLEQNVVFGRTPEQVPRLEQAMELSGVNDIAHMLRDSGGMHHRVQRPHDELNAAQRSSVALARTLAGRQRLLILEEPFSNLTAARRKARIARLREPTMDRTVILITYDPDLYPADLVLHLVDGRVQAGTHAELMASDARYRDLFGTRWPEDGD